MIQQPINRMTSSQIVAKQEEYRNKTISRVVEMSTAGKDKSEIAEECGIASAEVDTIVREANRKSKAGRPYVRRFF